MSEPQSAWTFWLAIWGAVTGTIACAEKIRTWWHDRARLEVEVEVAPNGLTLPVTETSWTIDVTNTGRRSASIRRAYLILRKDRFRRERVNLFSELEGDLVEGKRETFRFLRRNSQEWDHAKPIVKFALVDTMRREWSTRRINGADRLRELATLEPVEERVDPGGRGVRRFRASHGPPYDLVQYSISLRDGSIHEWTEWFQTEDYAKSRFQERAEAPLEKLGPDHADPIGKIVGLSFRSERHYKP